MSIDAIPLLRHKWCHRCLCVLWVLSFACLAAVTVLVWPASFDELSFTPAMCATIESKASSLPEGVAHTSQYVQLMGHFHSDDPKEERVDDSACHEAQGCERCHCGKGCLVYYPCVRIWADVFVKEEGNSKTRTGKSLPTGNHTESGYDQQRFLLASRRRLLHTTTEELRANEHCSIRVCTADKETNDRRLNEFWARFKTPYTNYSCYINTRNLNEVIIDLTPIPRSLFLIAAVSSLPLLLLLLASIATCVVSRRGITSHDRMFLVRVSESESNLEAANNGSEAANTYST